MERLTVLVLLAMCVVSAGESTSNLTENSVPAAECPLPANWLGIDAKSCSDLECNQNGTQGFCCRTSCSGRNCFYNSTLWQKSKRSVNPAEDSSPRGKRASHNCPSNWQGSKCNQNMCSTASQCNKGASCCPTKCGKKNCYMPQMGKRSVDEREERASHPCPYNWQGSKCNYNMCYMNSQCNKYGMKGYCCPTNCGKKNCY